MLFKNSIADYPSAIKAIQKHLKIDSSFLNAISSDLQGEKADVKLEFASGHNVDVNIKAFKQGSVFTQLTRTTTNKFCEIFSVTQDGKNELESLIVQKTENNRNMLFPLEAQQKWGRFL